MKKLKNWFLNRFLPMWAKETVFHDNKVLTEEVLQLRNQLAEKEAYISGMEVGLRSMRKIVIHTGEGNK